MMTRNKYLISYQSALDLRGAYQMLFRNLLPRKRFFLEIYKTTEVQSTLWKGVKSHYLQGDDASHITPKDSAGFGLSIARDVFQNFNQAKFQQRNLNQLRKDRTNKTRELLIKSCFTKHSFFSRKSNQTITKRIEINYEKAGSTKR
ncbi:hypothetical protein CEXT_681011 [Caerostris extrusa]|uniref:Uncharacterized protein n=1 Tax=Caerostris extrusa TaxID=172846 RepID=A0AAV4WR77_CAEEX|nr:hypothetical protein CEXT_681011 [Caerostris extrusa]